MAMSCVTGVRECTGCMGCQDESNIGNVCDPDEDRFALLTDDELEDVYEAIDGMRLAIMDCYDLSEEQARDVITGYLER